MTVYKQKDVQNPLYVTTLASGVMLLVFDGYALGSDGKRYYHVGKEGMDGVLETVGWCCEIEKSIII